jgi:hypothetical protein
MQEIFKIEGVLTAEELSDIWKALKTPQLLQKLKAAAKNVQDAILPHGEQVRKRLSQLPFFQGLRCKKTRCRVQASAFPGAVHIDIPSYKWRVVFRFPADGVSTTKLDLHSSWHTGPFASVLIEPGQVRTVACK